MLIGDRVLQQLTIGLDAAALRQRVIAHNLANLNTPGFKRSYVSFEDNLKSAAGAPALAPAHTHQKHINPAAEKELPAVRRDSRPIQRTDGNNVDIEREMLEMVTNQLRYNALIQQAASRLGNWRMVINEGRR